MAIWSWFKCHVWRRHEHKVLCGPEGLYLQCVCCGARSPGWTIERRPTPAAQATRTSRPAPTVVPPAPPAEAPRVIPFDRTSGARRLIKAVAERPARRTRRLAADEEVALLAAAQALPRGAGPRLHALIVAALETGCQRGELLALQWKHVDLGQRELEIPAPRSHADATRRVPVSGRLASVLQALAPEAQRKPDGRVFRGSAAGGAGRGWETAVLKAYGHEPEWRGSVLSPASRAQLAAIDLQFRDLRYEAAARWQEAGWPRQHIQAMLGRTSAIETDTLRNAARMGLHELMRRYDEARGKPKARMAKAEHRPAADENLPQWSIDGRR